MTHDNTATFMTWACHGMSWEVLNDWKQSCLLCELHVHTKVSVRTTRTELGSGGPFTCDFPTGDPRRRSASSSLQSQRPQKVQKARRMIQIQQTQERPTFQFSPHESGLNLKAGVHLQCAMAKRFSWMLPGPLQFVHLHALRKVGPVISSWQKWVALWAVII